MFTRLDARWLSETTAALYAAEDIAQITAAGMAAVQRRFTLVASTCEEVSYDNSWYAMHGIRCETAIPADYAASFHDNPGGPFVASGAARTTLQLRKIVSLAAWQRTDHYNGIARPVGFGDQLLTLATDSSRFFGLGIYRDGVFSDEEHALMSLLQPHLNSAWHRVRHSSDPVHLPQPLRVVLSPQLRPLALSARQCQLLRTYFPRWRESSSLPVALQRWIVESLARLQSMPPPHPLHAFKIDSAHGQLLVRCFPAVANGPVTLFMVETPHVPDFLGLRGRGLTTRECEVLHWIAQGKRDAEIAVIMGCAPATVSKHVENLLRKLHAENRAAAVSAARTMLGG